MASVERLIQKMKNQPHGITIDEADRVLRARGFEYKRKSGSHRIYTNGKDAGNISIPEHGAEIKRIYVDIILKFIGEKK